LFPLLLNIFQPTKEFLAIGKNLWKIILQHRIVNLFVKDKQIKRGGFCPPDCITSVADYKDYIPD
jgi:hypothetical protein